MSEPRFIQIAVVSEGDDEWTAQRVYALDIFGNVWFIQPLKDDAWHPITSIRKGRA